MQTQDAPAEIMFKLWPWLEANKYRLVGAVVGIVLLWGIWSFIAWQGEQKEVDAGQALTELMASQEMAGSSQAANFEQLASKYAGTAAGRRALLQAAAALFQSGDYAQAQTQFEKYLSIDPTGPLAATAEVGMATCLESQNKADLAAAAYQRVISLFPGSVADAQAELALGRITEQQGKYSEAENHFEAAARGAAGSTIAQEAMLHAADLKVKVSAAAAAAPKPGATNSPAAFTPTSIVQPAVKP